jgi:prepilin-type N-terminal cleavage/methylation domain-containing protein
MTPSLNRSLGFTLIELLVVMSIIATLAGLAIVGVPYYFRRAEKLVCQSNLSQIHKLLLDYESSHRGMPMADGPAFVLGIWGDPLDKSEKEANTFFCPSTGRKPAADLSNVTPDGIDYTGPDQSSRSSGRNRLASSSAGASEIPIICNKLPNPGDMTSIEERRKNLPHAGKGFNALYLNGSVEFIDANRFPDDLPVIGPEAPENMAKFRNMVSGFEGK